MKIVPQRVSEAEARNWFRARSYGLVGRLFSWLPFWHTHYPNLPRLELIWLPHYLFTIEMLRRGKEPGSTQLSVDAHGGVFMLVKVDDALEEATPEEACFPPLLTPEEAEAKGREQFLRGLIRRRGQRDKPTPGKLLGYEIYYAPFWVYYYERKPGKIDFGVYDAASGRKLGSQIKEAVINALQKH